MELWEGPVAAMRAGHPVPRANDGSYRDHAQQQQHRTQSELNRMSRSQSISSKWDERWRYHVGLLGCSISTCHRMLLPQDGSPAIWCLDCQQGELPQGHRNTSKSQRQLGALLLLLKKITSRAGSIIVFLSVKTQVSIWQKHGRKGELSKFQSWSLLQQGQVTGTCMMRRNQKADGSPGLWFHRRGQYWSLLMADWGLGRGTARWNLGGGVLCYWSRIRKWPLCSWTMEQSLGEEWSWW